MKLPCCQVELSRGSQDCTGEPWRGPLVCRHPCPHPRRPWPLLSVLFFQDEPGLGCEQRYHHRRLREKLRIFPLYKDSPGFGSEDKIYFRWSGLRVMRHWGRQNTGSLKDIRVFVPQASHGRRAFVDVRWGACPGGSEWAWCHHRTSCAGASGDMRMETEVREMSLLEGGHEPKNAGGSKC